MSELITKDMPEPDRYGAYLVINPDSPYPRILVRASGQNNGRSWLEGPCGDTWPRVRYGYEGCSIEFWNDHDRRIRCEALKLTADEASIAYATCVDATVHTRLSTQEIMIKAFAAVAASRERES